MFGLIVILNCMSIIGLQSVQAALTLVGKRCGTTVCSLLQYCSNIHSQCEDCVDICEQTSHNFDQSTCMNHCQGK